MLFCDIVGSTEIASHLDPEEWREIVADYHRAAAMAIERYGGSVAQYLGDGVMAYFGWPEAHDNDAERGTHAGLAILSAVSKLNQVPGRPKLSVRIGIDSGAVVVGAGTDKGADVFGDTPNIAARVQAAAEPGTMIMTDAVHRLVSGLFVVEERGAQKLKGIERPIQLYRVVRPSGVRGRLQAAAASHGLTPFVGREDELRLLMNRWERTVEGEGQVALVIGESGIGKSRLVQRLHEQIGDTSCIWVEAAASPLYQNTPFHPIADLLHELVRQQKHENLDDHLSKLQHEESEDPSAKSRDSVINKELAQLQSSLVLAGSEPPEAVPLIAPLLNLPIPGSYLTPIAAPEHQRRLLLAVLVEWLLGTARNRLMTSVVEDLHWADPSSLELIQILVEQGASASLFHLYTTRPEFRPQWPVHAHHTQVTLNRLNARDVRAMVNEVARQDTLSDEAITKVIARTAGVPLFIEELTRAVLEKKDPRGTESEIPVTLQDSLMSRLDRLGPAKEIAQYGAVIGREFDYQLLHKIHSAPTDVLCEYLKTLTDAELLYVRGIVPAATYRFKHALIRDVSYDSLLKARRREIHRHVAAVLERRFAEMGRAEPEILAQHYTEAGLPADAIKFWQQAEEKAAERSANIEAINHFTKSLNLLHSLEENATRRELELSPQVSMSVPLVAIKGQ